MTMTMTRTTTATTGTDERTLADLHSELSQFYADQMQTIDGGDPLGWSETFTADGEFSSNARDESVCGRTAILAATAESVRERAEAGVVHRHMMTMLSVTPRDDGTIFARSYVLVVATERGGGPRLLAATVCEDTLVRVDGGLQIAHRHVIRDDRPAGHR